MSILDQLAAELSAGPAGRAPEPKPANIKRAGLRYLSDTVWAQMQAEYERGKPKGHTTHVAAIDKHFTWKPGEVTILTGWPNEGKTELLLQMLLLLAALSGWQSALYMPENTPESEVYDTLIHGLTGQPTDRTKAGYISRQRYALAKDFVAGHFVVVDVPEESEEMPTLDTILDYFAQAVADFGVKVCVCDPWNQLFHDPGGLRTDEYLSNQLSKVKRFAKRHQVHVVITAHPNKPLGHRSGDKLPVPDAFLLNGGAMWNNKADNILAVYRPNKHINLSDPNVAFYAHKIKKQKLVGIPGSIGEGSEDETVAITFDRQRNRHLFNGVSPLDAPEVQAIYAPELTYNPGGIQAQSTDFA